MVFVKNLARCAGKDLALTPKTFAGLDEAERLRRMQDWLSLVDPHHQDLDDAQLRRLYSTFKTLLLAYSLYELLPYDGPVTLFEATEPAPGHPRPPTTTLGWETICTRPIEEILVAGNHFTIVYEPHARALAQRLGEKLDQVHARFADSELRR
jgi:thioesterase domain-containing protein